MSCDVAKFTITKGLDNTFVFTIKADGSTLPMTIVTSDNINDDIYPEGTSPASVPDTFVAKLYMLEDDTLADQWDVIATDPLSGKVQLSIPSADTDSLVKDKGSKTDRYYLRPVYKLIIECNTHFNGNFIAKVPEVYVD